MVYIYIRRTFFYKLQKINMTIEENLKKIINDLNRGRMIV
ncbi:MAG: hypothetical protein MPEBLZ_02506 [Candidatus Methanoperedens nitroreducens]|uniref:Uncharacterized protein n=1 Tax=Candidatus Methanoperedens nitratireducens TaxID=1392998 RepID=A0A0P8A449_9EURY|nr:MAG: hypothetical protein MPEBLZ_02506 [Candidatus Methanoperedens sp. BLZ1]